MVIFSGRGRKGNLPLLAQEIRLSALAVAVGYAGLLKTFFLLVSQRPAMA